MSQANIPVASVEAGDSQDWATPRNSASPAPEAGPSHTPRTRAKARIRGKGKSRARTGDVPDYSQPAVVRGVVTALQEQITEQSRSLLALERGMAQLIAAQTTSAIRPPSDQQPVQTGLGYLSEEPLLGSRITPLARPETAATNPELTMSYRKT